MQNTEYRGYLSVPSLLSYFFKQTRDRFINDQMDVSIQDIVSAIESEKFITDIHNKRHTNWTSAQHAQRIAYFMEHPEVAIDPISLSLLPSEGRLWEISMQDGYHRLLTFVLTNRPWIPVSLPSKYDYEVAKEILQM